MGVIDIVIVCLLGVGAILGLMKGFLKQLATLLGLVLGLLAARALYEVAAREVFSRLTDNLTVAQVLAFVAIWLLVPVLFWLVAALVSRLLEVVSLGWLNRLLGAVLGAAKWALLASLLIGVTEFLDKDDALISRAKKQESVFYYPLRDLAKVFLPAAKQMTEQYIL